MASMGNHGKSQHRRRFYYLNEISRGAYGVVHKALEVKTGEVVAIKEEFDGLSDTTTREVNILQSLPRHPSIVELRDVTVDSRGRVFVVMEYVENDLHRVISQSKGRRPYAARGLKTAMRQILEGVAFLHDHGIMHRDIKPANVLVSEQGELKLCDFGLSRHTDTGSESGAYTPGLVTLWYRAPELLSGESVYSPAIDVWSVGCVMAELVLGGVLFTGESELQQLRDISGIMGTPGLLRSWLIDYGAPLLTASGIDLLERLLERNPKRRITAREALNHAWFRESSC